MFWIGFLIGIFLGSFIGIIIMSAAIICKGRALKYEMGKHLPH